jgi:hypothetical protein
LAGSGFDASASPPVVGAGAEAAAGAERLMVVWGLPFGFVPPDLAPGCPVAAARAGGEDFGAEAGVEAVAADVGGDTGGLAAAGGVTVGAAGAIAAGT